MFAVLLADGQYARRAPLSLARYAALIFVVVLGLRSGIRKALIASVISQNA